MIWHNSTESNLKTHVDIPLKQYHNFPHGYRTRPVCYSRTQETCTHRSMMNGAIAHTCTIKPVNFFWTCHAASEPHESNVPDQGRVGTHFLFIEYTWPGIKCTDKCIQMLSMAKHGRVSRKGDEEKNDPLMVSPRTNHCLKDLKCIHHDSYFQLCFPYLVMPLFGLSVGVFIFMDWCSSWFWPSLFWYVRD